MVTNPTRKSFLDNLVNSSTITPDSRNFLIGALDPFHDFEYTAKGVPDMFAGNSVIQFLKRQVTISKPAGLAAGKNWDCHICTFPLLDTRAFSNYSASYSNFVQSDPTVVHMQLGTVSVLSGESGTPLLPDGATWNPVAYTSQGFSPSDNGNEFSLQRIAGIGYEATNTTAELYLNGSVTCYSQPQEIQDNWMQYSASEVFGAHNVGRLPPVNITQANSNINSVTWAAKEGCYVPVRMDLADTKFQLASAKVLAFKSVDSTGDDQSPAIVMDGDSTGSNTPVFASEGYRLAGLETCGSYFTGLTPETTITLTIRFIVEVAPTPANQTLISIAKPAAEYDPAALVLYTRAVRELPPATMLKNNADGDWWKVISGAIRTAAPLLGTMGPTAGIVGKLAVGAVNGIDFARHSVNTVRNSQEYKDLKEASRQAKEQLMAKRAQKQAAKKKPASGTPVKGSLPRK